MPPQATQKTDRWSNWKRRLAGEKLPIYENEIDIGFYRAVLLDKQTRKYTHEPVAFVPEGMRIVGWLGSLEKRSKVEIPAELWVRVADNPISERVYRDVSEKGLPWPDENVVVNRSNEAPDLDSYEGLRATIEDLEREAKQVIEKGPAKSQQGADQASNLADRLAELGAKVEAKRKAALAPVWDSEAKINALWKPLHAQTDIYLTLKQRVVTPFLRKLKDEAEAKEKAARAAQQAPPPKTHAGAGTRGRGQSLRTYLVGMEIEDHAALVAFFTKPDDDNATDWLKQRAAAAWRAKVVVPGVKFITEDRAV